MEADGIMVELLFHGAAGEVTGSMHMLRVDDAWIALDCGMFQGRRADADAKNRQWPMPPAEIAAVVVSHAHIDHTGRLPKLVRDGFKGPIFCTAATRDLCGIMLRDSAHIQQEDSEFVNRKRARQHLPPIAPLYTTDDALAAVNLMQEKPYNESFSVLGKIDVTYYEAGHMLGSTGIHVQFPGESRLPRGLGFTGDIGRLGTPILLDPAAIPPADVLLCESTYGGRVNPPVEDAEKQLVEIVKRTFARSGKLIVPAFSVGRTQTIVYFLERLFESGAIPRRPVIVDSPLAVSATEIFQRHPECYDTDAAALQGARSGGIFGNGFVEYTHSAEDSKKLNQRPGPYVIISASGMCETGRILHHLLNNLSDARNTVLLPGFQAEGTLGRRLAEGAKEAVIFHESVPVRAEVVQLHGFSGHADQNDLLRMLKPLASGNPRTFLVHGETDQSAALRGKLLESGFKDVTVAQRGQRVAL